MVDVLKRMVGAMPQFVQFQQYWIYITDVKMESLRVARKCTNKVSFHVLLSTPYSLLVLHARTKYKIDEEIKCVTDQRNPSTWLSFLCASSNAWLHCEQLSGSGSK